MESWIKITSPDTSNPYILNIGGNSVLYWDNDRFKAIAPGGSCIPPGTTQSCYTGPPITPPVESDTIFLYDFDNDVFDSYWTVIDSSTNHNNTSVSHIEYVCSD